MTSGDILIPEDDGLTIQQCTFLHAYIGEARGNGAEAARIAGYANPKQAAFVNLTHPLIKAKVRAYLDHVGASTIELLEELVDVAMAPMHMFQQEIKPATYDKEGNMIAPMIVRQDLSSKVRALESVLKMRGLTSEKQEIDHQITVTVVREDRAQ